MYFSFLAVSITALAACFLRFFQLIRFTDSKTGFVIGNELITYILYGVLILSVVFAVIYSLIARNKIRKISLTIFNKLRQEKILRYNESIYSEFRRLFDKNEENWNLNDYENEFYILSGYAYSNMYKKDEPELENEEGGIENV